MSSRLTLQLPIPPPALRSNGGFGNAFVFRDAFRKAKAVAVAEAKRVLADAGMEPPSWKRARYWLVLYHVKPMRLDPDNLVASCKAYIDGMAAAGLIANDKDLWPERPRAERVARMPRIEITIEEDL